ncbi:MAG: hypothetical protein J6586_12700 [Snodgrassella sp.]|nr:hypothetical protein [Snodgrassella sp.]
MPLKANTMPRHGTQENRQQRFWTISGHKSRGFARTKPWHAPEKPRKCIKTPFLKI